MTSNNNYNKYIENLYLTNEKIALQNQRQFAGANQYNLDNLPLISFLLPVFNGAKYIETSIRSCIYQTYGNVEIIVVDDGSTDTTSEILLSLSREFPCVKIINNIVNRGLVYSLNIGLENCKGIYIARMDADDICMPDRLEKQFCFLESHPDYVAVCSWITKFFDNGSAIEVKFSNDFNILKSNLFFYCPLPHPTAFFKADILKKLKYRDDYKIGEDYDLWRRIFMDYRVGVIQESLLMYRFHHSQFTNTREQEKLEYYFDKIAGDFFEDIQMIVTREEKLLHVQYMMMNKTVESKEVFLKIDKWLNKFLSHKGLALFLDKDIFSNYVFKQRWIDYYNLFRKDFNINQRLLLLKSKINKLGLVQQFKQALSDKSGY